MSEPPPIPEVIQESNSLSSISLGDNAPMCRICHNTAGAQNGQEPLHRVCWCKGTMGQVHKSCLEEWLTVIYGNKCPVCHYEYRTRRVYKPLRQWRCPPMDSDEIAVLIFTIVFIGMFLLQLSLILFLARSYKDPGCYTAINLGIAGIASGIPFFLTVSIALTVGVYFSNYWSDWRRKNKHVTVYLDKFSELSVV